MNEGTALCTGPQERDQIPGNNDLDNVNDGCGDHALSLTCSKACEEQVDDAFPEMKKTDENKSIAAPRIQESSKSERLLDSQTLSRLDGTWHLGGPGGSFCRLTWNC